MNGMGTYHLLQRAIVSERQRHETGVNVITKH